MIPYRQAGKLAGETRLIVRTVADTMCEGNVLITLEAESSGSPLPRAFLMEHVIQQERLMLAYHDS